MLVSDRLRAASRLHRRGLACLALVGLSACASGGGRTRDGGASPRDGGMRADVELGDVGPSDAGQRIDVARPDAGPDTEDATVEGDATMMSGLDGATPSDGGATPDAFVASDAAVIDAFVPVDTGPRDGGTPDTGPRDAGPRDAGVSAACQSALAAARYGFESGTDGFTHVILDGQSGSWPFDPWARGTPSAGPRACGTGSACFGTGMTQNYAQCGRAALVSPAIDLRACAGQTLRLQFQQWYAFWTGVYGGTTWTDGGLVEISTNGGTTWTPVSASYPGTVRINPNRGSGFACLAPNSFHVHNQPGYVGTARTWAPVDVTLPASATASTIRIRFAWSSGVSSETTTADTSRGATEPGWFVDDIRFAVGP